ncbi:gamma-secretase subunit PEN-2-like [Pecten maximus]|uniref:gamma-secretase subunit PEN-2-like n=1 Tax=Pecten maximus TaxID=6579 RepID=UPI001458E490|nr:gamma-secretase subunit PEN-2-like [Pecten maximus]
MDLKRMSNEDKLSLCRKYYIGGFAMLPFLWFVNSVWFFKEAFIHPSYNEQKQIRTYVIRSIIGTVIWLAIIITWVIVFQSNRVTWGIIGDRLSFVLPRGIP